MEEKENKLSRKKIKAYLIEGFKQKLNKQTNSDVYVLTELIMQRYIQNKEDAINALKEFKSEKADAFDVQADGIFGAMEFVRRTQMEAEGEVKVNLANPFAVAHCIALERANEEIDHLMPDVVNINQFKNSGSEYDKEIVIEQIKKHAF